MSARGRVQEARQRIAADKGAIDSRDNIAHAHHAILGCGRAFDQAAKHGVATDLQSKSVAAASHARDEDPDGMVGLGVQPHSTSLCLERVGRGPEDDELVRWQPRCHHRGQAAPVKGVAVHLLDDIADSEKAVGGGLPAGDDGHHAIAPVDVEPQAAVGASPQRQGQP